MFLQAQFVPHREQDMPRKELFLYTSWRCRVMEVYFLSVVARDQCSTVPQLLPHTEAGYDSLILRVLVHIKRIPLFIIS
jgi:hypothetical protein